MAFDSLFIQTGQTPPRGTLAKVQKIKPSAQNAKYNKATPLVFGTPYRRVYRDPEGLYATLHGQKVRVYMVEN